LHSKHQLHLRFLLMNFHLQLLNC